MTNILNFYNEIENHLLRDEKPSEFLNKALKDNKAFEVYPFSLLGHLTKIEQELKYHPEGNVWSHIMLVVDNAAKRRNQSCDEKVFMWAALLHDLGKLTTTKLRRDRITSYNHDTEGEILCKKFLTEFNLNEEFIDKVSKLVRWHMQPLFVIKGLPFADIKKMLSEVPLEEIALLALCDRLGRGEMDKGNIIEEENNIKEFISKCLHFTQDKIHV